MRYFLLVCTIGFFFSGCAAMEDYHYCLVNRRRAASAWRTTYSRQDRRALTSDYEFGWKSGYFDVSTGGCGEPPAIPPNKYWSTRFQSEHGQAAIEDWYAGFQDGAIAAEQDGSGAFHWIPTGPLIPTEATGWMGSPMDGTLIGPVDEKQSSIPGSQPFLAPPFEPGAWPPTGVSHNGSQVVTSELLPTEQVQLEPIPYGQRPVPPVLQSIVQPPVQQPPVQQPPVQQPPVQQTPVQQTPVQQTPVQQTPVQQNPVQPAPAPQTSAPALPSLRPQVKWAKTAGSQDLRPLVWSPTPAPKTPATPTQTTVTPTQTPVAPIQTPAAPIQTPAAPTQTPAMPKPITVTPVQAPATPAQSSVTAKQTPVTPTSIPPIPMTQSSARPVPLVQGPAQESPFKQVSVPPKSQKQVPNKQVRNLKAAPETPAQTRSNAGTVPPVITED